MEMTNDLFSLLCQCFSDPECNTRGLECRSIAEAMCGTSPLERGQIKSVQRLIRGVYRKALNPKTGTHPSIVLTGYAINTHISPLKKGFSNTKFN